MTLADYRKLERDVQSVEDSIREAQEVYLHCRSTDEAAVRQEIAEKYRALSIAKAKVYRAALELDPSELL